MADVFKIVVFLLISRLDSFAVNAGVVTLKIDEHEKACFGYDFEKDSGEVNADIQVSKGGDTEINWRILDPNGNVLITQDRISAADYEFNVQEGGEYMICLDNSFSKEYKIVTLAVENEISDEMTNFLEKISRVQETANAPPGLVNKSEILLKNAEKLIRYHEIHAAKQRRHYFLVDSNLSRVNGFSLLSCVIMVSVGVLQVFIVKSLFEDGGKRKFHF